MIVINYLFMKIVVYMMNLPDMIVVFNLSICTYSTIFIYYIFLYILSKTNQFTIRRTQLSIFFLFLIELQSIIEYCIFLFFKKEYIKKLLNAACCSLLRCPPGSVFLQTSLQPYFSLFHEHNCQPNMRTKY